MFWTTTLPAATVHVDPTGQSAVYEVSDLPQKDYVDLEGALFGGTRVRQGRVSFRVEWAANGAPQLVDNPEQRYRGVVREAAAQVEWSARTGEYEFHSAPLAESTTDAALLAQESNGSYY